MDSRAKDYNKTQEEEKENNVVSLELITGGKEPPDMDCWLGKKVEGSCFYVQNKQTNVFTVGLFRLAKKQGKVYILQMAKTDGTPPEEVSVNPMRFCQQFMLYEDLGVIAPIGEDDDDHRDEQELEGEGGVVGEPAPVSTELQVVQEQPGPTGK